MLNGKMWPERIKADRKINKKSPQESQQTQSYFRMRVFRTLGQQASPTQGHYRGLMLLQGLAEVLCCVIYSS